MYRPIAYAPNGFRELRKAGFDPLYAPHSFDPAIMHPVDRAEARKMFGLPDDIFVIGTVAVNRGGLPSRKAWPQNLEAFALFAKDKPNARYFIHTDIAADGFEGGINLAALCGQLGIMDKVMFCDQVQYRRATFGDDYLRMYYGAIDVLNAVSLGEGFGIPALEAQACGTPVIVSDFAAHRDLCFAGWKVSDGLRFYDGQASWVFIPDPQAIAKAMEEAHQAFCGIVVTAPIDLARERAISGAVPYALPRVIEEHWRPLLEEVERDIRGEVSRGVLRIVRPEEVGLV
jgi:glycosyltransferase involved in cell wall biosynthesis